MAGSAIVVGLRIAVVGRGGGAVAVIGIGAALVIVIAVVIVRVGWPPATTLSDGGLIVAASGSWPGAASTTTGTNRPAPPARSGSRNRRRHLKT